MNLEKVISATEYTLTILKPSCVDISGTPSLLKLAIEIAAGIDNNQKYLQL